VKVYYYVCELYEKELKYRCQRFSNNSSEFTDQEAMAIYLYSIHVEHRFNVKHIYEFANEYLRAWFPKLLLKRLLSGKHRRIAFRHEMDAYMDQDVTVANGSSLRIMQREDS
jgi:hypothetical protein